MLTTAYITMHAAIGNTPLKYPKINTRNPLAKMYILLYAYNVAGKVCPPFVIFPHRRFDWIACSWLNICRDICILQNNLVVFSEPGDRLLIVKIKKVTVLGVRRWSPLALKCFFCLLLFCFRAFVGNFRSNVVGCKLDLVRINKAKYFSLLDHRTR
jgi:hypothetical protein